MGNEKKEREKEGKELAPVWVSVNYQSFFWLQPNANQTSSFNSVWASQTIFPLPTALSQPTQIHAIGHKDRLGPRESVGETNSLIFLEMQLEVCPAEKIW